MMKIFRKYISVGLAIGLSLVVILSTSGLKMVYHHCNTSGNTDIAVTIPVYTLENSGSHATCMCSQSRSEKTCSSCNAEKPVKKTSKKCCHTKSEVFQAGLQYLVNQINKIVSPKWYRIVEFYISLIKLDTGFDYTTEFTEYPDPPPLLGGYGKHLIIAISQLKIPSA